MPCQRSDSDNDGSNYNTPSQATGKLGNAIDVNNNGVQVPDPGSAFAPTNLTVSAWVNTDVTGGYRNYVNFNTNNRWRARKNADESLSALIPGGTQVTSSTNISTSTWYHVVWTAPVGATSEIFIDGTSDATGSNRSAGSGSTTFYIGYYSGEYWDGKIDEVRVSDQILSDDWIKTEYNNQSSPSTFFSSFGTPEVDVFNIVSFSPADDAVGIALSTNLSILFNKPVDIQTGNLSIFYANGSSFENIDVSSGQVTGNGATTITANPTSDFDYSTEYYVNISATAFDSNGGESYAGISDNGTWSFITICDQSADPSDWYDCRWNKRVKLTIESSQINGDLSNFPVYVDQFL